MKQIITQDSTMYIGTGKEIRSIYKRLAYKAKLIPPLADKPIIKNDRIYAVVIEGECFELLNSDSLVLLFWDKIPEMLNK